MDVLNLAAAALFESLRRNDIKPELLLTGTDLTMAYMLEEKKKHSWCDFVKLYDNAAMLLGNERAAREIAFQGLYNERVSALRKVGTGLLDVKAIYWFLGTVACRHLFKDTVKFKYKKINALQIQMEVVVPEELEECPLLLETYVYLWENVPTLLGLPKATVSGEIEGRRGLYTVKFVRSSYLRYIFAKFTRALTGYKDAVELMEEFESQSIKYSRLVDEKSELLRIMSHDISNISVLMDMSLSRVLKSEHLNQEDRNTIIKAMKGSERLKNILKDVQKLEVAHLKGVELSPVSVSECLHSIEESFKEQLMLKNLQLVVNDQLPFGLMALADRSTLETNVLCNLLSNAIKFSHSCSQINIETYVENNEVVITVADFGIGMSSEEMHNIFNKRMRKSTIGTNGEVGTGFGLGIVNTYIQLYGGKISVSHNYPQGTIIKISLQSVMPQFVDNFANYHSEKLLSSAHSTIRN